MPVLSTYPSKLLRLKRYDQWLVQEAFVYAMNNVPEAIAPEIAIKQLMLRCAGERDIGQQEIMHQILGLKLYRSSLQVVAVSLDDSKRCLLSSHDIKVENSQLEIYGGRSIFGQAFNDLNLLEFFKRYEVIFSKAFSRNKLTVIRTTHICSSSPSSPSFEQYCKYTLTKYKFSENITANWWGSHDEPDGILVDKWNEYL